MQPSPWVEMERREPPVPPERGPLPLESPAAQDRLREAREQPGRRERQVPRPQEMALPEREGLPERREGSEHLLQELELGRLREAWEQPAQVGFQEQLEQEGHYRQVQAELREPEEHLRAGPGLAERQEGPEPLGHPREGRVAQAQPPEHRVPVRRRAVVPVLVAMEVGPRSCLINQRIGAFHCHARIPEFKTTIRLASVPGRPRRPCRNRRVINTAQPHCRPNFPRRWLARAAFPP